MLRFVICISAFIAFARVTVAGTTTAHLVPAPENFGAGPGYSVYGRICEEKLFVPNWILRHFSIADDPSATIGISVSAAVGGKYELHIREAQPHIGTVAYKKSLRGITFVKFDGDMPSSTAKELIALWTCFLSSIGPETPEPNVMYVHQITRILYEKESDGRIKAGKLPVTQDSYQEFAKLNDIVNDLISIANLPPNQRPRKYAEIRLAAKELRGRIDNH